MDVRSAFEVASASLGASITLPLPARAVPRSFAPEARRSTATFPFYEAATIGGDGTTRYMDTQRYAGDASLVRHVGASHSARAVQRADAVARRDHGTRRGGPSVSRRRFARRMALAHRRRHLVRPRRRVARRHARADHGKGSQRSPARASDSTSRRARSARSVVIFKRQGIIMKFGPSRGVTRGTARGRRVQTGRPVDASACGLTGAHRRAERGVGHDRRGRHRQLLVQLEHRHRGVGRQRASRGQHCQGERRGVHAGRQRRIRRARRRSSPTCFTPTWGDPNKRIIKSLHPAPGNHEYYTPFADPYYKYFGPAAGTVGKGYYSYDVGAWHVVVVNSEIIVNPVFTDSARKAQMDWVEQDLTAHKKLCTIAYWHHPRFSSGWHGSDAKLRPDLAAALRPRCRSRAQRPRSRLRALRPDDPRRALPIRCRGITEIVAGTGGEELRGFDDNIRANSLYRIEGRAGVLLLTLGAAEYRSAFLEIGGRVWDQSGGKCH